MRLPDFLVIGAMKAGTTSLCRDLESQPGIFFPSVKEPHTLCLDDVLGHEGVRRYASLFRDADADALCAEGSTGYTKLPTHKGVVDRARRVLGKDLKLIYIVREPISRSISHHYHEYRAGDAPRDFMSALRRDPMLAFVSKYAMQLRPWIDAFGLEQVYVIKFEDYVWNRVETVAATCRFLGVNPTPLIPTDQHVHNSGEQTLLPPVGISNLVRKITRSQWYKRNVHPRTPHWVRDRFKKTLYRPAAARPDPPSLDAVDFLLERLDRDWERLPAMLGSSRPFWDVDSERRKYDALAAV